MIAFGHRIHWVFGIAIYLFLIINDPKLDHVLNPIFVFIGSLFPDADHRKAPAGRIIPLWLICKHRGFSHSIQGFCAFTAATMAIHLFWGISFGVGYLSHLLIDSLTPSGVRWWWKRRSPVR